MINARNHKQLAIPRYILIAASCICMGLYPNIAHTKTTPSSISEQKPLTPGIQNPEVQVIQVQLKALGYYHGQIDSNYSPSTQEAVAKFQKTLGLKRIDGIADEATRISLHKLLEGKTKIEPAEIKNIEISSPSAPAPKNDDQYLLWWRLLSLGGFAALGFALYISYKDKKNQLTTQPTVNQPTATQQKILTPIPIAAPSPETEILPSRQMSLMPKVNISDKLMENLKSLDPAKQSKAIWHLSQKGDSRAIEPLIELLGSADSKQHSLILSALADISIRNLKPIRKALAMSVQNENSEVRQNAIRDLARIHDMMEQINQTLYLSLSDEDPEVQATVKYALKQIKGNSESNDPENGLPEERMDVLTRY